MATGFSNAYSQQSVDSNGTAKRPLRGDRPPFQAILNFHAKMGGVEQERLGIPLFRPYEKLISITIRGRKCSVPENQILLRAFQYLCPETIPYGRYCWNEECQYCRVSVKRPGGEKISQALSCKLMAEEGLEVQELSTELAWNLLQLFHPGPDKAAAGEQPPTSEPPSSSE